MRWFRQSVLPASALFACVALAGARARSALKVVASFPSSAISSAMSAATASMSRRWSAPTATRMSTRRRRRDAKKIADANLIVVNGFGFEGWLPRLVQSSGSKATVVTATDGITPLPAREI